jgi:hypothetical protein
MELLTSLINTSLQFLGSAINALFNWTIIFIQTIVLLIYLLVVAFATVFVSIYHWTARLLQCFFDAVLDFFYWLGTSAKIVTNLDSSMSDSLVSLLGYAAIAALVFFFIRSVTGANQQRQAELMAATRARQIAEATAERERQAAEKERQIAEQERLRATRFAARQEAQEEANTIGILREVGFGLMSIFLNSEGE